MTKYYNYELNSIYNHGEFLHPQDLQLPGGSFISLILTFTCYLLLFTHLLNQDCLEQPQLNLSFKITFICHDYNNKLVWLDTQWH